MSKGVLAGRAGHSAGVYGGGVGGEEAKRGTWARKQSWAAGAETQQKDFPFPLIVTCSSFC